MGAQETISSAGDDFTLNFSIPCDAVGRTASFEYRNLGGSGETRSFQGVFQMRSLAGVICFNSRRSQSPPGEFDSVSFSGFGTWSGDDLLHLTSVQISTAPDAPYVSVPIDARQTSNVGTKPEDIEETLP